MTFQLQLFAATEQVTGSLYLLRTDRRQVLLEWYGAFENRPPVYLGFSGERTQRALMARLQSGLAAPVVIDRHEQTIYIR